MIPVRTCAIVPLKGLPRAKRRLSSALPGQVREHLVLTMLEDVLSTLAGIEHLDCVVVTPESRIAEIALRHRAIVLPEPGAGDLNAAVRSGLDYACARGIGQALVLPADVPLATRDELAALIHSRGGQPGVTLAPSHDGNGTNGLLLAPPQAIAPSYGPGSYLEHLSQAMARRVDVNVLHLPGLARDIDEAADLAHLLGNAPAATRYNFLEPYLAAPAGPQPSPQGNER